MQREATVQIGRAGMNPGSQEPKAKVAQGPEAELGF